MSDAVHDRRIEEAGEALRRYDIEGLSAACRLYAQMALVPAMAARALAGWGEAQAHLSWQKRLRRLPWEEDARGAVGLAESALSRDGDCAEGYRALAAALMLFPQEAQRRRTAGSRAAELGPRDASNWYERWKAFGSRVDDGAIRKALELDPHHFGALHDLGVAFSEAGRHEAAAKLLAKASALNPANELARYNLGIVLARAGREVESDPGLADPGEWFPSDPLLAAPRQEA